MRILKATLPASSPGLLRQPLSDDSNVDSNVYRGTTDKQLRTELLRPHHQPFSHAVSSEQLNFLGQFKLQSLVRERLRVSLRYGGRRVFREITQPRSPVQEWFCQRSRRRHQQQQHDDDDSSLHSWRIWIGSNWNWDWGFGRLRSWGSTAGARRPQQHPEYPPEPSERAGGSTTVMVRSRHCCNDGPIEKFWWQWQCRRLSSRGLHNEQLTDQPSSAPASASSESSTPALHQQSSGRSRILSLRRSRTATDSVAIADHGRASKRGLCGKCCG